MLNYRMSVYALESEIGLEYVAEYPILKGVAGTGSTVSEAIEDLYLNAEENIKNLIDAGLPVPASDIVVNEEDYSGKLSVRLSKNLHRTLSDFSENQGVSINQCIVEAISSYITEMKIESKIKENQRFDLHKELFYFDSSKTTYKNVVEVIVKSEKQYQSNYPTNKKTEELSYA